jgi:hypothetical protein
METKGGVNQPSVDVLTHSGEHHPEEPFGCPCWPQGQ